MSTHNNLVSTMIKKLTGRINYLRTDLSMPTISNAFLREHVASGGTLYKVIEEPLFVDNEVRDEVMAALLEMIKLGASQSQSVLIVTCPDGRETIKQLELKRIWENIGGVAILIRDRDLESFLESEDMSNYVPRTLREQFVQSVPGGISLGIEDIDGLSVIGCLQKLVYERSDAREFLEIPSAFDGIAFSLVE